MTSKEFWRETTRRDVAATPGRVVWHRGVPGPSGLCTGPSRGCVDRPRAGRLGVLGRRVHARRRLPARRRPALQGPGLTNPRGPLPVDLAAETIGTAIGSQQFFARLLGSGSHFPGYLETDSVLTRRTSTPASNSPAFRRPAGRVIASSTAASSTGRTHEPQGRRATEQMRWQLQMMPVFRMPLAMVQDLDRHLRGSEQQDLWLGKHTMTPMRVSETVCGCASARRRQTACSSTRRPAARRQDAPRATPPGPRRHHQPRRGPRPLRPQPGPGPRSSDGSTSASFPRTGRSPATRRRRGGTARRRAPPARETTHRAPGDRPAPPGARRLKASRRRFERDRERGVPEETVASS